MASFAVIIIIMGALTLFGWWLWIRQRSELAGRLRYEQIIEDVPGAAGADDGSAAVLVASEHGRLLHINETARRWLNVNGGQPTLEGVIGQAQPADSLMNLFSSQSQASFKLRNRWVEASSHAVPSVSEGLQRVVVLREIDGTGTQHNDSFDLSLVMTLINEIGDTVDASMGIELALQVLLDILIKHLPSDAGEITIWDEPTQVLQPRGWTGDTAYLVTLSTYGGVYELGQGVAGWVAQNRSEMLVGGADDAVNVAAIMQHNPYTSVVAQPLLLGGELVGTLALFSEQRNAYGQRELSTLQAIGKSVTIAIQNAVLYARQEKRIRDMANIQEVAEQSKDDQGASRIYALLNERIAGLLDAEMCGILLYDRERQMLQPQVPFFGLPDNVAAAFTINLLPDSPQRDIWQQQPYWVSGDVADEPLVEALGLDMLMSVAGIHSTGLFPMQIGGERIGIVAVSNKRDGTTFTPRDIQTMRLLATQAAIVVENVRLYQEESRIDSELVGLQEMTHAIGALDHESEFYAEIVERIARLMNSDMCALLLHDPQQNILAAQSPFFGVSAELVGGYQIPLPPGSVMEELWTEENVWYSNRVASETLVFEAGLDALAEVAGVRKTMIAVMSAGGRRIGAVQVSNKANDADYTPNDARLLQIFATQAGAIIENARLYRELQRRAAMTDNLREVAQLASAVLTPQDSFQPALEKIAQLMQSQVVFINVIDSTTQTLTTRRDWAYGVTLTEPVIHDLSAPGYNHTVALSGRPYLSNQLLGEKNLLPGYRKVAERIGMYKTVMVQLRVGDRALGEIGVVNPLESLRGDYTRNDITLMEDLAAQVAAAVERQLLYEQTDEDLRRRVEELDAIARVSNRLTTTFELDKVLEAIRAEAIRALEAEGCSVLILKPPDEWHDRAQPEIVQRIGETQHLQQLDAIEREALQRATEPVLVSNYDDSDLTTHLQAARSAIAAPIVYLDGVVGLVHVYDSEPFAFDDRDAGFLMMLTSKASLGYQNAMLFEQQEARGRSLSSRVDQLSRIFELGQMTQSQTSDIETVLEAVAYSVQQSVGYDTVLMMLVDEQAQVLRRIAQAGMPLSAFQDTKSRLISLRDLNDVLAQQSYQLTPETHFFPIEHVDDWYSAEMTALSAAYEGARSMDAVTPEDWRDGDMLLVKISGTGGDLLGLVMLDRPYDNKRPTLRTVEVLEIFAHQAATMIENTRIFLESRLNAEREAQLNEMLESIASTLDLGAIARAVARGARRIFSFTQMTLALNRDETDEDEGYDYLKVRFEDADGNDPQVTQEQRPTLERTALGRSYDERKDYLYHADDEDVRFYDDLRSWYASGEQVSLIMPLIAAGSRLGVLHFGSEQPGMFTSTELRQLIGRMAQLISSTLQNARLFNYTMNLQILNRSVVESIQQGIVVLDNSGRIININEFMRVRFGWDDDSLQSDLFQYRPQFAESLKTGLRNVLSEGRPQEYLDQRITALDGSDVIANFYLYPLRSGLQVRGVVLLVEDITERRALESTIEARANQLAALTDVSTRITSSLDREEVLTMAMGEMNWIIAYDTLTVWRRNGSYMVLETHAGFDGSGSTIAPVPGSRFLLREDDRIQQLVDSQRAVCVPYTALGELDNLTQLPGDDNLRSWLGVPLVYQGHVNGMLLLTSAEEGLYQSRQEQYVAFAFASQVAIALANADLFEQAFERTDELSTLLQAAQATSLARTLDEVFDTVADLMFTALEMDDCIITTWDEVGGELDVEFAVDRQGQPLAHITKGMVFREADYPARNQALRKRDVVVIADVPAQDDEAVPPPFPEELAELRERGHGARLLVPLVVRENSIGLIQLDQKSNDQETLTQQKVRLARVLGTQVAVAIQNAQLTDETTARFVELDVINNISQEISSTLNIQNILRTIQQRLPLVTDADELYVALYDEAQERITFPMAVRRDGSQFSIPPRAMGKDEVSYIIRRGLTLPLGADRFYSIAQVLHGMGIESAEGSIQAYLGVPFRSGGKVTGVLAIRNVEQTDPFGINDQRILDTVGSQLGLALQNARLFEQVSGFADTLEREVQDRTDELEEERDRLDQLYQITSELSRTLNMEHLLQRALGMVGRAVNATDGVIMIYNPVTDSLSAQAWLNPNSVIHQEGEGQKEKEKDEEKDVGHIAAELASWLLAHDDTVDHVIVVDDVRGQAYWDETLPGAADVRSALAVILETNEDPRGVMVLLSDEPAAFTENHLKLLVPAAAQVATSMSSTDLYLLIRNQAEQMGTLLGTEQREAQKNLAILEGINDGVLFADAAGNIVTFNTAAERILQIPRDEVIDKPVLRLAGLYRTSDKRWQRLINAWTQRIDSDELPEELLIDQIDLGDRIVSAYLSPVYIGDLFLGTVSVFRDITRDVEADRTKSEFVKNVSHEMRTPLTPIAGYTDMLLQGIGGELSGAQMQFVRTIKENVERLTALVNDVLDIAKLDREEMLLVQTVDVADLVSDVMDQISTRVMNSNKGLHTRTVLDPSIPPIRADREKLREVLVNVVENAFNYTEPGGKIDVSVQNQPDEKSVLISIADTGVGIPDDFKEAVWRRFERYQQHAVELDVAGTGLGLSLAQDLVALHNGEIWFESKLGTGTTFYIKLPIEQPAYVNETREMFRIDMGRDMATNTGPTEG